MSQRLISIFLTAMEEHEDTSPRSYFVYHWSATYEPEVAENGHLHRACRVSLETADEMAASEIDTLRISHAAETFRESIRQICEPVADLDEDADLDQVKARLGIYSERRQG